MTDVHLVLRRLRGQPYGVRHVRTGAAALELMEQESFLAVLLDHRLPDMPGTRVCRTMRERGVSSPILLISSLSDETLAMAAEQVGATEYLVKDLAMPDLARHVSAHIGDMVGAPAHLPPETA